MGGASLFRMRNCASAILLAALVAAPGCSGDHDVSKPRHAAKAHAEPRLPKPRLPKPRHVKPYRTDFEPPGSLWKPSSHSLRGAHEIPIEVNDGTCFPGDPRYTDAERRFDHVTVAETRYAAVVTVYMQPEPRPPKQHGMRMCAGVGLFFTHVVRLPHPLGNRALVDGAGYPADSGFDKPAIVVPAPDKRLERIAEAHFKTWY